MKSKDSLVDNFLERAHILAFRLSIYALCDLRNYFASCFVFMTGRKNDSVGPVYKSFINCMKIPTVDTVRYTFI